MPPIETFHRHQAAVLWAANGTDTNGEPRVDSPVEIQVRWQNRRLESRGPETTSVSHDAVAVVAQDVVVGSIMWLGELADLPSPTSNLFRVVEFQSVPDLKNVFTRRLVLLSKHGNSLPTVNP
jgi:hypothetical protein